MISHNSVLWLPFWLCRNSIPRPNRFIEWWSQWEPFFRRITERRNSLFLIFFKEIFWKLLRKLKNVILRGRSRWSIYHCSNRKVLNMQLKCTFIFFNWKFSKSNFWKFFQWKNMDFLRGKFFQNFNTVKVNKDSHMVRFNSQLANKEFIQKCISSVACI